MINRAYEPSSLRDCAKVPAASGFTTLLKIYYTLPRGKYKLLSSNDESALSSKDESDFNLSLRRLRRLLELSTYRTKHPSKKLVLNYG
jgi:hypothetical protein